MEKIILASSSPRRKQILGSAGIPFDVIVSDADETCPKDLSPEKYVMTLAERKLDAVVSKAGDEKLVLAADTVVAIGGEILGKPADKDDAIRMLSTLSGEKHEVYTGMALQKNGVRVVDFDVTSVYMRKADHDEITAYVSTGEPLDKAGAYAIQGLGSVFVEKICGNYHNVVGLPLGLLVKRLKEDFNISVLS